MGKCLYFISTAWKPSTKINCGENWRIASAKWFLSLHICLRFHHFVWCRTHLIYLDAGNITVGCILNSMVEGYKLHKSELIVSLNSLGTTMYLLLFTLNINQDYHLTSLLLTNPSFFIFHTLFQGVRIKSSTMKCLCLNNNVSIMSILFLFFLIANIGSTMGRYGCGGCFGLNQKPCPRGYSRSFKTGRCLKPWRSWK